jgi:hypothetical protein
MHVFYSCHHMRNHDDASATALNSACNARLGAVVDMGVNAQTCNFP